MVYQQISFMRMFYKTTIVSTMAAILKLRFYGINFQKCLSSLVISYTLQLTSKAYIWLTLDRINYSYIPPHRCTLGSLG